MPRRKAAPLKEDVHIVIDRELLATIRQAADRDGQSLSVKIQRMLARGIEKEPATS